MANITACKGRRKTTVQQFQMDFHADDTVDHALTRQTGFTWFAGTAGFGTDFPEVEGSSPSVCTSPLILVPVTLRINLYLYESQFSTREDIVFTPVQ